MKEVDILATAKKQWEEAISAWQTNHDEMLDDLEFAAGKQWPDELQTMRESEGRPCHTINKLPAFIEQVVGDQLLNDPQVKFIPVDGNADPDTAEILTGLLRNIEHQSDADIAYDTAFDSAVTCGKGAWRIITDYVDDESFDQEIRILRTVDRFSIIPDPLSVMWDYSDGRYLFVCEDVSRESFEQEYPDADHSQWDDKDKVQNWITPDYIRVAEYFYKKQVPGELYQIQYQDDSISVVRELPEQDEFNPYIVLAKRKLKTDEIWYCKLTATQILEKQVKWIGKYFPVPIVWGKELIIGKKRIYRGLIRYAKDPQRLYNYSRSANTEATSLAPKAPYLMTPKQLGNHAHMWNTANSKNWPYLLYDHDAQAAGPPQRQPPAMVNSAIQTEIMISDQEMHDTTGLQLASLGKKSNEQSGKAIAFRQQEGDVATYFYMSNLARAKKYSAKVILDLIPKIYDTARIIRILGPDGKEKMVRINQEYQNEDGETKAHMLNVGKYDVAVQIGPAFTTQRQEAAANMMDYAKLLPPQVATAVLPLVAKNQDWPGAGELAERIEKFLPPGIVDKKEDKPEQVDPAQQMQAQQQAMLMQQQQIVFELELEKKKVELQQEQARLEGLVLDNKQKSIDMGKDIQEMTHKEARVMQPVSESQDVE